MKANDENVSDNRKKTSKKKTGSGAAKTAKSKKSTGTAGGGNAKKSKKALKKFAIYKGNYGFYFYEYYDTLKSLKGTGFEKIITKDRLPVVLDGKGGYYHFTEGDYAFVKIVETDKDCPLPIEKMFFKNDENFKLGWMSPDGDTYACDYTSHSKAAKMLAERFCEDSSLPDRALGKAGWIKIIDSWDGTERMHGQYVYSLTGKITNRQADKLFDLGLYENPEVQKLIKDCEDYW